MKAQTPADAEAHVEEARADLAATLERLKDNLQPRHLLHEAIARPRAGLAHWLGVYGRFASESPISGLIIGAAALALSSALVKHAPRRLASRKG